MTEIIFVCTGNTCRSPMAEALAKKYLSSDLGIHSRGLSVAYGQGANPKSIIAMDMEGIDIRDHHARQFDMNEVGKETLVLGMTHSHKEYLLSYYPELKGQVYTLLEYVGLRGEVTDPFGQGQDAYNQCANLLKKAILEFKKLKGNKGEHYDSNWM